MGWCPGSCWCSWSWTRHRSRHSDQTRVLQVTTTKATTATATQTQTATATQTVTQPAATQTITQPAATQTVTTTSVQQPTTLSYVPPLSPSVQQNVDTIVQNLVNAHAGETIVYSNCSGTQCFRQCILRVRVKNGVITGFDNDDSINQGIGMEDQYSELERRVKSQDAESHLPHVLRVPRHAQQP